MKNRFHIAIPVVNLLSASKFYRHVLGCRPGRTGEGWADFNFFGHQLSLHETDTRPFHIKGEVDQVKVPIPHWGVVLTMDDWILLVDDLTAKSVSFLIEPTVRYEGAIGEQATAFFADPSNNVIEIKGFRDLGNLFEAETDASWGTAFKRLA